MPRRVSLCDVMCPFDGLISYRGLGGEFLVLCNARRAGEVMGVCGGKWARGFGKWDRCDEVD